MEKVKKYSGFSLIEILIVVGLILILAAITIVAINPAKHFRDTRNSQRSADVSEMLNAVTQFTSEEGRTLADLGSIPLCEDGVTPASIGTSGVDLDASLVDEFIVEIPKDPTNGTDADTGYTICQTDGGRVEIAAPRAEETDPIVVKR
jgi:prepilin-type N-terminal cleavage/methylation domain-containing protein